MTKRIGSTGGAPPDAVTQASRRTTGAAAQQPSPASPRTGSAPAAERPATFEARPARIDDEKRAPRTGVVYFPPVGRPSERVLPDKKPGVLMMGGEHSVDEAFRFMHAQLTGGDGGGNIVVLRASGKRAFDEEIYGLAPKDAPFDSVQEILVAPDATDAEMAAAARVIAKADGVFLAGGDQAKYVRWEGTPIQAALATVAENRGVIGGRSAGLHVLGSVIFDAKNLDGGSGHTTKGAVADPFGSSISFSRDLLSLGPLAGARVLTDSHFAQRDRMGRLAAWLARQHVEGAPALGVGVDEGACIVVDENGKGTLRGEGKAYLVTIESVERLEPGRPLRATISIVRLGEDGDTYDFASGATTGTRKTVVVDGEKDPIYSSDPYAA